MSSKCPKYTTSISKVSWIVTSCHWYVPKGGQEHENSFKKLLITIPSMIQPWQKIEAWTNEKIYQQLLMKICIPLGRTAWKRYQIQKARWIPTDKPSSWYNHCLQLLQLPLDQLITNSALYKLFLQWEKEDTKKYQIHFKVQLFISMLERSLYL